MHVVEKNVIVTHTPAQMYALVADFPSYPRFLPWCSKGEVASKDDGSLLATLHIDYLKIRQHFSTRNVNVPDESINMHLVDGPFRSLDGQWRFLPLGECGCKIEFRLRYEFSSLVLEKLIGPVFNRISAMLVDAFIQEADRQYGDD